MSNKQNKRFIGGPPLDPDDEYWQPDWRDRLSSYIDTIIFFLAISPKWLWPTIIFLASFFLGYWILCI